MISVIIPAHNEAALIEKCIQSIKTAAAYTTQEVEIIVCINRCTDNTESIARSLGVIVTEELEANVAKVRNQGLSVAKGDILVTLDADSTISPMYLSEIEKKVKSGKYLAGSALMVTSNFSVASVLLGLLFVLPALLFMRFSGGMFWMTRQALVFSGGFDTRYLTGEDFHLWRKLKKIAKQNKLRFGYITKAYVITSDRKMGEFGPWFMLTHPHWFYYAIKGDNQAFADQYLYKTSRSKKVDKSSLIKKSDANS